MPPKKGNAEEKKTPRRNPSRVASVKSSALTAGSIASDNEGDTVEGDDGAAGGEGGDGGSDVAVDDAMAAVARIAKASAPKTPAKAPAAPPSDVKANELPLVAPADVVPPSIAGTLATLARAMAALDANQKAFAAEQRALNETLAAGIVAVRPEPPPVIKVESKGAAGAPAPHAKTAHVPVAPPVASPGDGGNYFATEFDRLGHHSMANSMRTAPPPAHVPLRVKEFISTDLTSDAALLSIASTGGASGGAERAKIAPKFYEQVIPHWRSFGLFVHNEQWKQDGYKRQALHMAAILDAMIAIHSPSYVNYLPCELVATRLAQLRDVDHLGYTWEQVEGYGVQSAFKVDPVERSERVRANQERLLAQRTGVKAEAASAGTAGSGASGGGGTKRGSRGGNKGKFAKKAAAAAPATNAGKGGASAAESQ